MVVESVSTERAAGSAGGEIPGPEDDSEGFDLIERDHLRRRFVPDFEWLAFPEPSPRNRLTVPLSRARVALISTAGAHLPEQRPMGPGGDLPRIPVDAREIRLSHAGYHTRRASLDPEVVFPVGTLRALVQAGFIGGLAPTALSTMGYIPRGERVLERLVLPNVELLRSEDVDLALLVPA